MDNLEVKMEDYETIQQIGKGILGSTFILLHKTHNTKYVLKKISLAKQTEKFKRTAHQEMNLVAKLNHPYIVEVKGAWIDKGTHLCVLTNYCEGGNMTEVMRKARGKPFSEEKLCKWMTQLLLAVDYLHSNRVVHGDLKLSNIFLNKENDIQLGDFGLVKLLNNGESPSSTIFNRKVVGTLPPNFMCPELLENIPYGYKSDMWSLGCCLFEIVAHQPAFKAPDMAGLVNKINRSLISPLPIVYSSTLRQMIKTMLRKTPEHRPTAADLLRHPHIQPYLICCHNPGPVFLPVFPLCSPNKPRRRLSSNGSVTSKENGETDPTPETIQNGSTAAPMNVKEDTLVVKKVDFTSYSPSVSNNSDASKNEDSSVEFIPLNGENDENLVCIPDDSIGVDAGTYEIDPSICELDSRQGDNFYDENSNSSEVKSNGLHYENITIRNPTLETEKQDFQQPEEIIEVEYETDEKVNNCSEEIENIDVKETLKNVDEMVKEKSSEEKSSDDVSALSDPSTQRADALESLLELCAKLLKQNKLEELSSVLKPFGEEAVSSRETAIWLTKSLIKYSSS